MELRTFDAWSRGGYRIKQGSRAVKRDENNVPLFASDQVWNAGDDDMEEDSDFAAAYGLPWAEDR